MERRRSALSLLTRVNSTLAASYRSAAVPLKILHQIAQRHDWLARRWLAASEQWGCQPPLTDRLGQPRVCQKRTAARLWRYDFCHDAIAVRDQDDFATSGEADI